MWEIEYYESSTGRCPVKEFLDDLDEVKELPFVKYKISLLEEHGYLLKRPHATPLDKGIYELRTYANKRQIRILYFFILKEKIIFTHGIIKKGNTKFGNAIDPKEIKRAVNYREDYIRKNEL